MKIHNSVFDRALSALLSLLMLLSLCSVGLFSSPVDAESFDPASAEVLNFAITVSSMDNGNPNEYFFTPSIMIDDKIVNVPDGWGGAFMEYSADGVSWATWSPYSQTLNHDAGDFAAGECFKVITNGMEVVFTAMEIGTWLTPEFTGTLDLGTLQADGVSALDLSTLPTVWGRSFEIYPVGEELKSEDGKLTSSSVIFGDPEVTSQTIPCYAIVRGADKSVIVKENTELTLLPVAYPASPIADFASADNVVNKGDVPYTKNATPSFTLSFLDTAIFASDCSAMLSGLLTLRSEENPENTVNVTLTANSPIEEKYLKYTLTPSGELTDGTYSILYKGTKFYTFGVSTVAPSATVTEGTDGEILVSGIQTNGFGCKEVRIDVLKKNGDPVGEPYKSGSISETNLPGTTVTGPAIPANGRKFLVTVTDGLGNTASYNAFGGAATEYVKAPSGSWGGFSVLAPETNTFDTVSPNAIYFDGCVRMTYTLETDAATVSDDVFPTKYKLNGGEGVAIETGKWQLDSVNCKATLTFILTDRDPGDTIAAENPSAIVLKANELSLLELCYEDGIDTSGCNLIPSFLADKKYVVDTSTPEASAVLAGANEEAYFFAVLNGTCYLVRSDAADSVDESNNTGYENNEPLNLTLTLTVTDVNFDGAAYKTKLPEGTVYTAPGAGSFTHVFEIPYTLPGTGTDVHAAYTTGELRLPAILDAVEHLPADLEVEAAGTPGEDSGIEAEELLENSVLVIEYDAGVGFYVGSFLIDRRAPQYDEPEPTPTPEPQPGDPVPTPTPESEKTGALTKQFSVFLPEGRWYTNGRATVWCNDSEDIFLSLKDLTDGEIPDNVDQPAGIRRVKYEFGDTDALTGSKTGTLMKPDEDGSWKIPLRLVQGKYAEGVTLTLTVYDKVGNNRKCQYTFNVDTLAPVITVTAPNTSVGTANGPKAVLSDETYSYFVYSAAEDTAVTITVEDQNLDPADVTVTYDEIRNGAATAKSVKLSELDYTAENGVYTAALTAGDGVSLTNFKVNGKDLGGFVGAEAATPANEAYLADTVQPVISVTTPANPISSRDEGDGTTTFFYSDPCTLVIKVSDRTLRTDKTSATRVKYTRTVIRDNAESSADYVILLNKDGGSSYLNGVDASNPDPVVAVDPASPKVNEEAVYTVTLKVNLDETISGITVTAEDTAENEAEAYENANAYRVDNVKPAIVIAKPAGGYDAGSGIEYFAAEQTVTVTAIDWNLNPAETYVSYTKQSDDGTKTAYKVSMNKVFSDAEDPTVTVASVTENGVPAKKLTVKVEAGTLLTDLKVTAEDMCALKSNAEAGVDWCVDTTAPAVSVKIDGDVESYFVRNGQVYVRLTDTVKGLSGLLFNNTKKLTLTVSVTDANLSDAVRTGSEAHYVINNRANSVSWKGSPKVNVSGSTLTYTDSVTVKADQSGSLLLDLSIADLAGNVPADYALTDDTAGIGTNKDSVKAVVAGGLKLAAGKLAGGIVVDRARPLSDTDEYTAPVIELTPSTNKIGSTAFSVNTVSWADGGTSLLYSGDMSYHLKVYDPTFTDADGKEVCSGLESLTWEIESYTTAQNVTVVTSGDVAKASKTYSDGQSADEFDIPVKMLGAGESDDIILRVTAIDNAGNEIYYVQRLAIDKLAPRVTVSYDNNDVQNEKYFKANRTVTVTVNELNFDPNMFSADRVSYTTFSTEPVFSGWTQNGSVWTATASYVTDGDYTFAFETVDRAGWMAVVDYTNGGRNAAPREFTVDKTVPVIGITFDNNSFLNGRYFKADRTATVTISEHNFRASDVTATVTASLDGSPITVPAMSGFTSAGNVRTATIPFLEDGDYTLQVQYTDLAGNPARIETVDLFTIDKTDPTIEITGLDNMAAYAGAIAPMITFGDVNIDPNGYSVTWTVTRLTGLATLNPEQEGAVDLTQHNSVIYSLNNPAETTENDGIYVLSAEITDLAGNSFSTDVYTYSVNRFGSVYTVEDAAMAALLSGGFTNEAPALTVFETNTDALTNQTVTLSINGTTLTLEEGVDYTVTAVNDGGSWHRYRYDILPEAFMKDGEPLQGAYEITVSSEDKAGNKNSNRTNVEANAVELTFTLDNEAATGYVDVTGLGEGKNTLKAAETAVTAYWEDNIGLAKVEIYLNGELIKTLEGEELAAAGGQYTFTVTESNDEQSIRVVLTDAAGNVSENSSSSFYLNSSAFRHFLHNTPLVIISSVVLAAVIVLIVVLAKKSKKKAK